MDSVDALGLKSAFEQAQKSYDEGGIPIGSSIVYHGSSGESPRVIAAGYNQRVQKGSATLHGEISALENGGRLKPDVYRNSTIFTTLSPCSMCTGAILLYKIPRVVIGENKNYFGGEELLKQNGVEVIVLNDEKCTELMTRFINEKPEVWYEDIGEHTPKGPSTV